MATVADRAGISRETPAKIQRGDPGVGIGNYADLWRRIVFNIMISNVDDHLRNHGFLYTGSAGWRLSPIYDLEPTPERGKQRVLYTCIDLDNGTASLIPNIANWTERSEVWQAYWHAKRPNSTICR